MLGSSEEMTLVGTRHGASGPRVLIADADVANREWLREVLAAEYALQEVEYGTRALQMMEEGPPRIIVIGRLLADMSGSELIDSAAKQLRESDARIRLFLLTDSAGQCADVDEGRVPVFYRLTPGMDRFRARALLEQAAATLPPQPPIATASLPECVVPFMERIRAQIDSEGAAREAIAAVMALFGAQRARCLYCDEDTGNVWSAEEDGSPEATASKGLTGFAIRTGASIAVPNVGQDTLYRAEVDDPNGTGRERLAVQPVVGLDGHVHAVLIAVRDPQQQPFSAEDMAHLEALATSWAPYLQQLAMRAEADNIVGDHLDRGPSDLFRQEAIVSLLRRGARGDVVRVHPGWVRAAYWLVLAALLAVVGFATFAKVHEYTDGPAIVRFTGRTDVVAFEQGTVTGLEAQRGEVVKEGQPLVRLHDADQLARLRGLESEFERKLIAYLQSPADATVRQALAQIVSDRETARAGVEAKLIRAHRTGTIKEVLVRNGQRVDAGTPVMSIVEEGAVEGLSVVAFLPGGERPRLRPHQQLTLTLPGYRGAQITARVSTISAEVLGANDARTRYLDNRVADSLPLHGTVVVVEAPLGSRTFEADGQQYELHDGMIGTAEIRLASRSLLKTFMPGLER